MQDNKLIITHQDGSQNVVENPFLPMQATYAALAADPNAMPELSDESRAEILRQIASERRSGKMSDYNNELLNDCAWFAEKHRGKNKQSGPHWSTIIRFTKLFDEAARLQQRVDTLEAYIDDFTPDSMQIAKKQ